MREGEDFAIRLIEVFEAIAREHVSTWKGTVVKFTGDGMVARFPSVPGAVQCGLDLMEDFARKASDLGHRGELRVGINMGEVVFSSDGDVHGDVVHIAARVQAAAPRGTLVITEEAWIQLKRSLRFKAQDLGEYELKNVEVPVRLYAIQRS
jgi:class 3 adenylate cyclase